VQVVTVAGFLGRQWHYLQVAQRLQAVSASVDGALHVGVTEFGPRFQIQQEEQPIHVPQALQRQPIRVLLTVDPFMSDFTQVVEGFIGNELDSLS